jgi:hypothetical protein
MNARMAGRLRPTSVNGAVLVVVLALLGGGIAAGCASGHATTPTAGSGSAATTAPMAGDGHDMALMSTADAQALWSARPAFVTGADASVQEAYAYALSAGGAIQYLPCYCGCAAMDHRSNLDCFLRRGNGAGPAGFEEHASYCEVCVQTALMAKRMLAAGSSLGEVRAAVDAAFGGNGVPGTATELPPS